MAKQTITIRLDTGKEPKYNGIEKDNYHALHDFFEGLDFKVESIDFGLDAPPAEGWNPSNLWVK